MIGSSSAYSMLQKTGKMNNIIQDNYGLRQKITFRDSKATGDKIKILTSQM